MVDSSVGAGIGTVYKVEYRQEGGSTQWIEVQPNWSQGANSFGLLNTHWRITGNSFNINDYTLYIAQEGSSTPVATLPTGASGAFPYITNYAGTQGVTWSSTTIGNNLFQIETNSPIGYVKTNATTNVLGSIINPNTSNQAIAAYTGEPPQGDVGIKLSKFDLSEIDNMRERILQAPKGSPMIIGSTTSGTTENLPYQASTG